MDRHEQIRIARRLLAHIENGTAESAPHQLKVEISRYSDPALWEAEVEAFYKRLPIVAGMSCELPAPGTFKADEIVGVPVLLVRDGEGRLRAFLNVCRHRGAPVAAGCGQATRFSCPYHAWTYDQAGQLVGITSEETFGPIDRSRHALTPLPCAERAGLIFVGLTPGMPFDIDAYLAGVDRHIAASEPETLHYGGERLIDAPNWKIVMEGHLESYHFASLHRNSIGPTTFNNCGAIDRFGPHILITVAHKHIVELRDRPESEWHPLRDGMITAQYVLFPGASITLLGNGMMAQMVRPGEETGRSTNTMVMGFYEPADDPRTATEQAAFLDRIRSVLADEDYAAGFDIQRGLKSGAQQEVTLGLNEPGVIYYHETMRDILAEANG
ncbi:MAG: aromatic ring-hydroxylating dioxygenase subunit alpha [Novosphingobium sp.]|nr:aromatic ring-hydroxylating dioxygenase subunit alpha [Novosphingobium sp.]MCP5400995.1 aromatic ring-hydroxylating dioxygenase subunit alpha [Novosphingobium sp.]